MAFLLGCEKARVEFPTKTVFEDVSLGLDEGDRIGVVGKNGDGKSTLLSLLAGIIEPDEGRAIRTRGVRVLTNEELALKDVSLSYVSKLMGREFTRAPLFRKVLQSICWQINSGRQVIVVGVIQPDGTVKGGTGWGAEFAKICNKPLLAFDQDRIAWFGWVNDTWVIEAEPVITTTHFTKIDDEWVIKAPAGTANPKQEKKRKRLGKDRVELLAKAAECRRTLDLDVLLPVNTTGTLTLPVREPVGPSKTADCVRLFDVSR